MITGTAQAKNEQIMTLAEVLRYCNVRCVYMQRAWIARGWLPVSRRWVSGYGATPADAVTALWRKIGGGNG